MKTNEDYIISGYFGKIFMALICKDSIVTALFFYLQLDDSLLIKL